MKRVIGLSLLLLVTVAYLGFAAEAKRTTRPDKVFVPPSTAKVVFGHEDVLQGDTLSFFDMEPDGDAFLSKPFNEPPAWHVDTFRAYGGSGQSYWCGDPATGGYDNGWYMTLDTPPIDLRDAFSPVALTLQSLMSVECSGEAEGWDGGHVRISKNDGNSFEMLLPVGGYDADSCWGYHFAGQETPVGGYPCWNCTTSVFEEKVIDLDDYIGFEVIIRFVFAADQLMSTAGTDQPFYAGQGQPTPSMVGWLIDNIQVTDASGQLFFDDAGDSGPTQMTPGVKHLKGFELTTATSHSPTHSWVYDADDLALYRPDCRWLETPWIDIPAQQYPEASFHVFCDLKDADGNDDDYLDDYYYMFVKTEAVSWVELTHDYNHLPDTEYEPQTGFMLWDKNAIYNGSLNLENYSGEKIKLGWSCRVDSNDDGGNGSGLHIDDLLITSRGAPTNDVGIKDVVVPYPTSVDYSTPVTGYIKNYGTANQNSVILFYFTEDADGNMVGTQTPTGPPYPSIPSFSTLEWEFDLTPQDTGAYRVGFFKFIPDQYTPNDTGYSPYFWVYPEKEGYIAHNYRLSLTGYTADPGEGPAMLFEPPHDIYPFSVQTLEINVNGTGELLFHVYAASGPNDTIPNDGQELIEPIAGTIPEHEGGAYYFVDVSDQTALQNMEAPFFVWVELVESADLHWAGATSPYPPTHSFSYNLDSLKFLHSDADYLMRCYLNWGVSGACQGLRGDPTGDASINVLDVLAVANHILGVSFLTGDGICRGDCNGDGTINILDCLNIANVILGIIPACPGGCARTVVTPETVEFMKSLESYLSPADFGQIMTLVKGEVTVPTEFGLAQNFPNPFNPTTSIQFTVGSGPSAPHVTLRVFNLLGQEVATLVDEVREAGSYTARWDASLMASGIYFYRLEAGSYSATRQMVLMK